MRSAKINKDPKVEWSINFDIYGESKKTNKKEYLLEIDKIALFRIEESFITGSDKYLNYIENNFFRKYIDENICKKEFRNKINYNNFVTYFICNIENKERRKEFFDEFPSLILYQKEMNYNFTLDANDLFTIFPDNNRILFNIDFIYNYKKWIIGKPFFKKYQLIFNSDTNLISYYIQPKYFVNDNEINNKEEKGLQIFIIILLIILAFGLGIIIGRTLCSKFNRKIRANELENNYKYIINENIKKNNIDDIKDQ